MIEESKLLMLLLAIGLWLFLIVNKKKVKQLPEFKVFLGGLVSVTFSWFILLLEVFFHLEVFESLEHIFLLCSTCLFAVWSFRVFPKKTKESE